MPGKLRSGTARMPGRRCCTADTHPPIGPRGTTTPRRPRTETELDAKAGPGNGCIASEGDGDTRNEGCMSEHIPRPPSAEVTRSTLFSLRVWPSGGTSSRRTRQVDAAHHGSILCGSDRGHRRPRAAQTEMQSHQSALAAVHAFKNCSESSSISAAYGRMRVYTRAGYTLV